MIHPVILSGGAGTRLWPMSRMLYPKQLLSLVGDTSLLQQTVTRIAGGMECAAPLIIANEEHRFIVAEQLRGAGVKPDALLLEPVGRNTAPAAAVAALYLTRSDSKAVMLVLPSDHMIGDVQAFCTAVGRAERAAQGGHLVTFGVTPERPETGYGYIARGSEFIDCPGAFAVADFVEKPDEARAQHYIATGDYYWNSGIFMFGAAAYLAELEVMCPDMVIACRAALDAASSDSDFIRLDAHKFSACPSDSIDYAVMERTAKAAVVPVSMKWSDLGSWDALWDISERDALGNAIAGNVVAEEVQNCYLRSEAGLVAAIGVEGLVVVATDDAVMITQRNRTQDVKKLVTRLGAEARSEVDALATVHRPWGTYKSLHNGPRVQVKHIVVKPGGRLSLQLHHHRAEHWVVVQGTAKIVRGDEEIVLTEDQSVYIPLGAAHRLENPGKIPLHVIEVQSGSYLGEDDIVRIDDTYGRI